MDQKVRMGKNLVIAVIMVILFTPILIIEPYTTLL